MIEKSIAYKVLLCLGRESNPHGRFGPRDFLATMAFATVGQRSVAFVVWTIPSP